MEENATVRNDVVTPFLPTAVTSIGDAILLLAEKLPNEVRLIMMTLLGIIFVIGVLGNLTAMVVFLKTKSLRTPPNFMIVSLCCSDFGMIMSNLPFMFWSIHKGYWYFDDLGCQIYAFFGSVFSFASIGVMAAISIDRYYVICHCFKAMQTVSPKRTTYIIFVVWVYAVAWALLPFFGVGSYIDEGWGIGCTFDFVTQDFNHQLHVGLLFLCGFFTPVFIIIACYSKIVTSVKSHKKEMRSMSARSETSSARASANTVSEKTNETGKDDGSKGETKSIAKRLGKLMQEYQIAKVGITATVIFCLSWGPYGIMALYSEYFHAGAPVSPLIRLTPVTMAKASAIWNPFVYAISHRRFKSSLAKTLQRRCPCIAGPLLPKSSSTTTASNTSSSDRRKSSQKSTVAKSASLPIGLSAIGDDVKDIGDQTHMGTTSTLDIGSSTINDEILTDDEKPTNLVETLSLTNVRGMGSQST